MGLTFQPPGRGQADSLAPGPAWLDPRQAGSRARPGIQAHGQRKTAVSQARQPAAASLPAVPRPAPGWPLAADTLTQPPERPITSPMRSGRPSPAGGLLLSPV